MNRFFKTLLTITGFIAIVNVAIADRGVGKKNKTKIVLNISTPSTLRNSISFNLKSGLAYKGSLLANQQSAGKSIMNSSIVTYQKGNAVYIIPYKQKIIMPDMQQGYTGLKLVLRHK